jgi:lipid-A-disaccharide synthase
MLKKILLIAGEASGDKHGSALLRELKKLSSDVEVVGTGGPQLRAAGLVPLFQTEDLAVMGFTGVALKYCFLRSVLHRMKEEIDKKPDLLICIDYPGFNFPLAKHARKRGVPVLYYIAPQVWAWRPARAKQMAGFVDRLAVVFDFEQQLFEQAGVPTTFVGHPLLEYHERIMPETEFRAGLGCAASRKIIGILPGSRKQEIERILPVMLGAATILTKRDPAFFPVVSCAPMVDPDWMKSLCKKHGVTDLVYTVHTGELIRYATAAAVTSGTATLETALAETPLVVVYKTSPVNYFLLKGLVKIRHISLVNILSDSKNVPELIQGRATAETIAEELRRITGPSPHRDRIIAQLKDLPRHLGSPGASSRVAELALQILQG